MDAAIEDITAALPGGAQPAWKVVKLKDLAAETVHLGVATCCQPGGASANN